MSETIPESEVQAAIAELDKVRGDLMRRPGVTAVDVGLRYRGGELTHELAIRVHVARKLPPEALGEDQLLPEALGRFPVDVIEAAYEPQEPRPANQEVPAIEVVAAETVPQGDPPEVAEARPLEPMGPENND